MDATSTADPTQIISGLRDVRMTLNEIAAQAHIRCELAAVRANLELMEALIRNLPVAANVQYTNQPPLDSVETPRDG